jgi:anti-sigma factor RsiW
VTDRGLLGPNPTCAEVVELVSAYLDGEQDATTTARLVAHVDGCPGCGPYVEQFRETVRLVGTVPPTPGDIGIRERLLAAFRNRRGRWNHA